jgi:hypothetical protein
MKGLCALVGLVALMLVACGTTATPARTPILSPDLEATIAARVQQRLAEIIAHTPTPTPTVTPTPLPTATSTATPIPTATPAPTPVCQGQTPHLVVEPSIVRVTALTSSGLAQDSGFVVDSEKGFILTATHVVRTPTGMASG